MKNSMMTIAVISALGMAAAAHAQTPSTGQDRARSESADPAKKCDGLKGDARTACLKDAQKPAKDDMKSPPKVPETKK